MWESKMEPDGLATQDFQSVRDGLRLLSETLDRVERQHAQELRALRSENAALLTKNQELSLQVAGTSTILDVAPEFEETVFESESALQKPPSTESESLKPRAACLRRPAQLHIEACLRAQSLGTQVEQDLQSDGDETPTPPESPTPRAASNPSLTPQVGTAAMLAEACEMLSDSVELAELWKEKGRSLGRTGRLVSSYKSYSQPFEVVVSMDTNSSQRRKQEIRNSCMCKLSLKSVRKWLQAKVQRPSSLRRLIWDGLGMTFIGYDLFTIPLQVFDPPSHALTTAMSGAATCYWTIDIPSTFFVGFHQKGVLEMRLKHVAMHYARTWLLFDVMIVGVDWAVTILTHIMDSSADRSGSVGFMRMGRFGRFLRTFRLLRLLKLQGMLSDLLELIQSEAVHIISRIVSLIVFIITVNHFIACGFYAVGMLDWGQKETWVSANLREDEGLLYRYFTALHWSMTQFTPASMEVVPKNVVERIYTVVTLLFAMVTFSSFVGSITNAMTRLRNLNSDELARSGELRRYLKQNKISTDLSNNIWCWLQHAKDGTIFRTHRSQVSILKMLPKRLDTELHNQIYLPYLVKHPFFASFNEAHPHAMGKLYRCFEELSLDLAQELFTVGERAEMMYFCFSGSMKYIVHLDERKISTGSTFTEIQSVSTSLSALCGEGFTSVEGSILEPGQWVSEPALWIQWQHCGHMVAKVHSELFAVKADRFQALMQRDLVDAWQPARYAKLYARYISEHDIQINDIWADIDAFQGLAIQAFTECVSSSTTPGSFSDSSSPSTTRPGSPQPRSSSKQIRLSQASTRLSQTSSISTRSSRHGSPRSPSRSPPPRRNSTNLAGTPRVSTQSDIAWHDLQRVSI